MTQYMLGSELLLANGSLIVIGLLVSAAVVIPLIYGRRLLDILPFGKEKSEQEIMAERHRKMALRLRDRNRKEFDLSLAIQECKAAISVKPDDPLYRSILGTTYLGAPEAAIIRGINVGFELIDSARLALAEYEKAISEYERDPSLCPQEEYYSLYYGSLDDIIYAHLCLGQKDKAKNRMGLMLSISSFYGGQEPKMIEIAKDDVEVIIEGLAVQVGKLGNLMRLFLTSGAGPFTFAEYSVSNDVLHSGNLRTIVKEVANQIKELKPVTAQPDKARRHIEQAIAMRNRTVGKYKQVRGELDKARQFAPDVEWWYHTLCGLAS